MISSDISEQHKRCHPSGDEPDTSVSLHCYVLYTDLHLHHTQHRGTNQAVLILIVKVQNGVKILSKTSVKYKIT